MTGKLTGRVGLITGAASGIGRAGALLFSQEGASLVTMDVDQRGGSEVIDLIRSAGGTARFELGDVSSSEDVRRAVNAAVDTYGRLDLLWSNAGIGAWGTVIETSEEEWDRIVDVNLKSGFLLAKYGIPELIRAGGGTMVYYRVTSSFAGAERWSAYCATKGGLLMLTRAMALDFARDHVRVNCVCPGSITHLSRRQTLGHARSPANKRSAKIRLRTPWIVMAPQKKWPKQPYFFLRGSELHDSVQRSSWMAATWQSDSEWRE